MQPDAGCEPLARAPATVVGESATSNTPIGLPALFFRLLGIAHRRAGGHARRRGPVRGGRAQGDRGGRACLGRTLRDFHEEVGDRTQEGTAPSAAAAARRRRHRRRHRRRCPPPTCHRLRRRGHKRLLDSVTGQVGPGFTAIMGEPKRGIAKEPAAACCLPAPPWPTMIAPWYRPHPPPCQAPAAPASRPC